MFIDEALTLVVLRPLLRLLTASLDAMPTSADFDKVNTLLSQVGGIDKAYRFLVYSLRIVCSSIAASRGPDDPLVARLNNFTGPLADTRMCLRLFGSLPVLQAVIALHCQKKEKVESSDKSEKPLIGRWTRSEVLKTIDRIQLYSLLVYYPAEHVYWLGAHKVLQLKDVNEWSRWSCRAWGLWIVLDIANVLFAMRDLEKKSAKEADDGSKTVESAERKKQREDLRLRFISLMADLPLAIHWSLKSYPLPDFWVGIFGVISTISGTWLKWKSM